MVDENPFFCSRAILFDMKYERFKVIFLTFQPMIARKIGFQSSITNCFKKYSVMNKVLLIILTVSCIQCRSQIKTQPSSTSQAPVKITVELPDAPPIQKHEAVTGAEQLDILLPKLYGKRVGLIVNHTALIKKTHLADTLKSRGVNVVRIFGPEHGFRGE